LKAVLFCLEAEKGIAAGDAWLAKLRLARGDLDDETRLLPLLAFHAALVNFAKELPDGLDRTAPFVAARENLGVWARVLRVARSPEEAFARIESSESEYGRTTRWENIEGRPGYWRGRVRIGHDPKLEKDGLLAAARAVELSMVPALFGHPRGTAVLRHKTDEVQEFEVRWKLPLLQRDMLAGGALGAAAGAAVLAGHLSAGAIAGSAVAPVVGLGLGFLWFREQVRRIETAAQAMRVSALERSLALRETESRTAAGELEGVVVAGQYRIGSRMGSGASGVIYQATRLTDGLPVAIKLLRAAAVHDVTASDRLRRESEALGLSWHPNVVESIDHGHLPDGTSYLVMELLRGETLGTRLNHRARMPVSEVLPIAKQIAEALVAIHAAGVVHRDLKPSNIYLVPDENVAGPMKERVKVFDFGIARVEWEEMRITTIGAPLGTPGYMSPEQESGEEIDARSDIYAAGAIIYECLVGQPPAPAPAEMWKYSVRRGSLQMRMQEDGSVDSGVHEAARPPSAASLDAIAPPVDAPPELRALVERALAKRPADRYQDARALLAAIRALEHLESAPRSTGSDGT
jgi:serine/threonine-protein kinase